MQPETLTLAVVTKDVRRLVARGSASEDMIGHDPPLPSSIRTDNGLSRLQMEDRVITRDYVDIASLADEEENSPWNTIHYLRSLHYTWYRNCVGLVLAKKLDRALISHEWCMVFPEAFVETICRVYSNHCLVLVTSGGIKELHGEISFRFLAA
ncbi:hypothetical protein VNO78_22386 [Psophocarpus tetragonolobus]|uniref:Uncharacterized protein n=1 Tax=Psophocarpus tetragonolobus TaxID=3891 RepID=A0AAN9SI43_PSOTE